MQGTGIKQWWWLCRGGLAICSRWDNKVRESLSLRRKKTDAFGKQSPPLPLNGQRILEAEWTPLVM